MSAAPEQAVESDTVVEAAGEYANMLQEKILFGLSIYRELSPTMLQVFLGTSTPANVWRPILDGLIAQGKVCKTNVPLTSPHDRSQNYTVIHLASHSYTPPTNNEQQNASAAA